MAWNDAIVTEMAKTLAYAAECQLATVEDCENRKSTPKCVLRRHKKLADDLVRACFAFGISPTGPKVPCQRLSRKFIELAREEEVERLIPQRKKCIEE